jgi:hypothetical protein
MTSERVSRAPRIGRCLAALLLGGTLVGLAVAASSVPDLFARADAAFEARHVPERMAEAIAGYEALLPELPDLSVQSRAYVLNRLAQLCYEVTTFIPGDTPEDRVSFEKGRDYGLRSLRLDAGFARHEEADFAAAVSTVSDPAALLWTADNWGGLCGMNPLEGFLHLRNVRTLYERCLVVSETYWGASAHNALGALLVVTPVPFGGDPEAGRAHLEAAIALAPSYLQNRVVYAQYWGFTYNAFGAVNGVRDAGLIDRELTAVLDAPLGDWPFWNREAKKEAEDLLRRLDEMGR